MLRLTHHMHDDEDALTDLLNERSRGGWEPALVSQGAPSPGGPSGGERLTVIFQRALTRDVERGEEKGERRYSEPDSSNELAGQS